MAVAPTGAIYKSLSFDGESSRNYGVYITGEAVYNAPVRDVEMITIPGRNGTFALDNGRFENIEVTYPAGIFADNEADFAEAISDFRNFLCSRKGYVRLQDEYNPDEYRLAVYKSGLEVSPAMLRAGEFNIVFDCKPQRFLKSGENAITIGEWRDTETVTGDIVEVENPDEVLGVKSLSVALAPIQDLHGYDKPWSGGNGANVLDPNIKMTAGTYLGLTLTTTDGYTFRYSGTATASGNIATSQVALEDAVILPAGTYIGSNGALSLCKADGSWLKNQYSGVAFTVDEPFFVKNIYFEIVSGRTYDNTAYLTLAKGSTKLTQWTPYSNICPISGRTEVVTQRTGVNIWDEEWEIGNINTTTGQNQGSTNTIRSKNYIPVKPNTSYWLTGTINEGKVQQYYAYGIDKTFIGTIAAVNPFVTPSDCYYLRFRTPSAYGTTYNHDISINYPSTDHDYHAFDGDTYTTALGRTVYGGTLDVVSGELVVDRMTIDLGDLNWRTGTDSIGQFFHDTLNGAKPSASWATPANAICSNYPVVPSNAVVDKSLALGTNAIPNIYIRDTTYASASDFKTAMSGVQLCYELATPQTYQLSPQEVELLKGTNNVWSDSGDITLEYGQLPNLLVNPTLFEASPLIKVVSENGGDIAVNLENSKYEYPNNYVVNLENSDIGEIDLRNVAEQWEPIFFNFNKALFNDTDIVTVEVGAIMEMFQARLSSDTVEILNVVKQSGSLDIEATIISAGYGNPKCVKFDFSQAFEFPVSGLSSTENIYTVTVQRNPSSGTAVITDYKIEVGVQAGTLLGTTEQFSVKCRVASDSPKDPYIYAANNHTAGVSPILSAYGYSTLPAIQGTMYIDTETGLVYKYDTYGNLFSLNRYARFEDGHENPRSDLMVLTPGLNEFTYYGADSCDVTPRWWKI